MPLSFAKVQNVSLLSQILSSKLIKMQKRIFIFFDQEEFKSAVDMRYFLWSFLKLIYYLLAPREFLYIHLL